MKIIGRGLIASALYPYQNKFDDVVVFASGVSDSSVDRASEFEREYSLLYETLKRCLKSNRKIVYFSSGGAIYGNFGGIRDENTPLFPLSPYGRHKVLCEALVRQSTLPHLILRLPNIVGERQNKNQLIPALVHQARQGEVNLYKYATRDLLSINDFVTSVIALLEIPNSDGTIILASGYSIPITDIFAMIQDNLPFHPTIKFIDKGDKQIFSTAKLQTYIGNDLPFHPDYYKLVIKQHILSINQHLP